MARHALPGIYKEMEHEDSVDHGQWTDAVSHESLETVEKKEFLESPKLSLGMVSTVVVMDPPTSRMPMVVCLDSLWVYCGQISTKHGTLV